MYGFTSLSLDQDGGGHRSIYGFASLFSLLQDEKYTEYSAWIVWSNSYYACCMHSYSTQSEGRYGKSGRVCSWAKWEVWNILPGWFGLVFIMPITVVPLSSLRRNDRVRWLSLSQLVIPILVAKSERGSDNVCSGLVHNNIVCVETSEPNSSGFLSQISPRTSKNKSFSSLVVDWEPSAFTNMGPLSPRTRLIKILTYIPDPVTGTQGGRSYCEWCSPLTRGRIAETKLATCHYLSVTFVLVISVFDVIPDTSQEFSHELYTDGSILTSVFTHPPSTTLHEAHVPERSARVYSKSLLALLLVVCYRVVLKQQIVLGSLCYQSNSN